MPPHPTFSRSTLLLSSHLHLGLPSDFFPSGFPTKTLYIPILPPICATCPAYPILLDFIAWKIFGEQIIKLSLCSFLHSFVTSSILSPNILLSTLYSNTLSLRPPSMLGTKFHTHTKQRAKLEFRISWTSCFFFIANWKTKYSVPSDRKHSINANCFQFVAC